MSMLPQGNINTRFQINSKPQDDPSINISELELNCWIVEFRILDILLEFIVPDKFLPCKNKD